MKTENRHNPSQPEKKLSAVELLTETMYGILQEAAEERNLSVNDEVFVNEVYWALTKLKLRLYEESNRADQKK